MIIACMILRLAGARGNEKPMYCSCLLTRASCLLWRVLVQRTMSLSPMESSSFAAL